MAIPGGVRLHVQQRDIMGYTTVAGTAYEEGELVKWSADGIVTPCTGATDLAVGVIAEELTAALNTEARTINIILKGIVRMQAGNAITRGCHLSSHTNGRPAKTTTNGHLIYGQSETTQATAGSTFVARVDFYNVWYYYD